MEGRLKDMLTSKAVLWDKDGTLLDTFGSWIDVERKLAKAMKFYLYTKKSALELRSTMEKE